MAIASGGGHWIELRRLMPAFEGLDVFFVSIAPSAAEDVPDHRYYSIRDVSRRDSLGFMVLTAQLLRILLKERPTKIITTGSAPAFVAICLAKVLFRAEAMWIDSIANVRVLSSSGQQAGRVADVWLTQWPELSAPDGPHYWGSVL
jgi:UDP-N-acetylglucosamine:LPS N-acetylglucosamine transferase